MNSETILPESVLRSPLLASMNRVQGHVGVFKARASAFYFQVMLSQYRCPTCKRKLRMDGPSRSVCESGHVIDPTQAFQSSNCCGAGLIKRACHYACAKCGQVTPSKFLFDERIFNHEYFSEAMRRARENKQKRVAELKKLLANSRSDVMSLITLPELEEIPGLAQALDVFVGAPDALSIQEFQECDEFSMGTYREAILAIVRQASVMFTALPIVSRNARKDKAWRFLTLVYMEHEREVRLTQYGNDLLVEKNEADLEG